MEFFLFGHSLQYKMPKRQVVLSSLCLNQIAGQPIYRIIVVFRYTADNYRKFKRKKKKLQNRFLINDALHLHVHSLYNTKSRS